MFVLYIANGEFRPNGLTLSLFQHEFWTEPRGIGYNVDIQGAPEYVTSLATALDNKKIPYSVAIDDLEK